MVQNGCGRQTQRVDPRGTSLKLIGTVHGAVHTARPVVTLARSRRIASCGARGVPQSESDVDMFQNDSDVP